MPLRVDGQRGVGPHHVGIELDVDRAGLDVQHPDAVLADLVVQQLEGLPPVCRPSLILMWTALRFVCHAFAA